MELTVERVCDAMNALVNIGQRRVNISTLAHWRLARLHDALKPHFEAAQQLQFSLVQKYGEEVFSDPEKTKSTGQWGIQPNSENHKQYEAEWAEAKKQVVVVPVKPIPLGMFGDELNGIEMKEFALLGELIEEPKEEPAQEA